MVRFFLQIGNLIQLTFALMWLSLIGAHSAITKMAKIANG